MNSAQSEVTDPVAEVEGRSRKLFGWQLKLVGLIAFFLVNISTLVCITSSLRF